MGRVRQSHSYVNDYVNNSRMSVVREKPEQVAKGKITISVFDENGDIVQEGYTENIINNSAEKLSAMVLLTQFQQNHVAGNYHESHGSPIVTNGVLKDLVLTSNDKDEDINYPYVRGTSLSVKSIGSRNVGESSTTIDEDGNIRIHVVMDYQTNEANGSFQSLYWTATDQRTNMLNYSVFNYRPLGVSRMTNNSTRLTKTQELCADRRGNILRAVYDKTKNFYQFYEATNTDLFFLCKVEPTYKSTPTYRTPYQDSDYNYYQFEIQEPKVASTGEKLPEDDVKTVLKVIKYSEDGRKLDEWLVDLWALVPNKQSNITRMKTKIFCMDADGNILIALGYMFNSTGTSTSSAYHRTCRCVYNVKTKTMTKDFIVTTNYLGDCSMGSIYGSQMGYNDSNIYGLQSDSYTGIQFKQIMKVDRPRQDGEVVDDYVISFYADKNYKLDTNNITVNTHDVRLRINNSNVYPGGDISNYQSSTWVYLNLYNERMRAYTSIMSPISTSASYEVWGVAYPMPQWVAHTKLPSPILKTSNNTMKIQYDFVFPVPRMGYKGIDEIFPPETSTLTGGVCIE